MEEFKLKKTRYSDAQRKATNKYRQSRSTASIVIDADLKKRAYEEAERLGLSFTQYVVKLIKDNLEE